MNFADTNWLTAMFFTRHQSERTATAARFMRVPVEFQGKRGEIALDQLRAVDKMLNPYSIIFSSPAKSHN